MASTGYFLKGVDNFDISGYPVGTTRNLGISYNAGVFKIVQADGSDLSTGRSSGQVVVPHSSTPGLSVTLNVTAATHLFQDASHASDSDIIGQYFGTTTGVVWDTDRPFYLYALNADNTDAGLIFGISPHPCLTEISIGSQLAWADNPDNSSGDYSVFCLTTVDPTVTHAAAKCVVLGSFRMQKDASDDWTVSALTSLDGLNQWNERIFGFPSGQMGAATGNWFFANGGTPPSWITESKGYILYRNGVCNYKVNFAGDGGTDGSGAVETRLAMPYAANGEGSLVLCHAHLAIPSKSYTNILALISLSLNYISFYYQSDTAGALQTSMTNLQHAAFSNGARSLYVNAVYQAF